MDLRKLIEDYLRESEDTAPELNPLLFDADNKLKSEIKDKILEIVDEFVKYTQIDSLKVLDVRLVGSNAAYNYTEGSDLDVHIVVDLSEISDPEIIGRLYFDSVKSKFKDSYDITIKGIDVEVYVEDINTSSVSNGVYSVTDNRWIKKPDDLGDPESTELEMAEEIASTVIAALKSTDSIEDIQGILDRVYLMRKNSLDSKGELGAGNLAFKMLRSKGVLDMVRDTLRDAKSEELSLESLSLKEGTTPLKTLKGSVIKRSKYGVGKEIGGQIYLHKNYSDRVIPETVLYRAQVLLAKEKPDFEYNCVMYDKRKPDFVRFDEAPDFDTAREPTPGNMLLVDTESQTITERSSAQIWHHKWLWVMDDYTGFDVQESYEWSKTWLSKITNPSGSKDKWEQELRNVGLSESLSEGDSQDESLDEQYKEYINNHKAGVLETFENIMKPILLEEGTSEDMLSRIGELIDQHDASKFTDTEFPAYRDRFYKYKDHEEIPSEIAQAFDIAWNHHQKSNPHHWNYWVLINDVDEPQVTALDMPFEYIIELLCDWQSAGKFYGNSAKDWYEKNGGKMILSEATREVIEKYIDYLT